MVTSSTKLSPNYYAGNEDRLLIGIHTMEAPESASTAENVAAYFAESSTQASAHWCVDNNSRVRCVADENSAWTMPPTNHYSLNVEIAGYAAQTSGDWEDAYSQAALDIAAQCVAEWCEKYGIPVRHLTTAQLLAKEKGIAGHIDVNNAFHGSTHTDPGPNFPWSQFLSLVNHYLGVTTTPAAPVSSSKPNCTVFQKAVRTTADNQWGTDTDKHGTTVSAAQTGSFPNGVAFAQACVGATQDGEWGPLSKAQLKSTVINAQNALKAMGFNPGTVDGDWGPNTQKAYNSARSACHI